MMQVSRVVDTLLAVFMPQFAPTFAPLTSTYSSPPPGEIYVDGFAMNKSSVDFGFSGKSEKKEIYWIFVFLDWVLKKTNKI